MKTRIATLLVCLEILISAISMPASNAATKTYTLSFAVAGGWTTSADNKVDAGKTSNCATDRYSKVKVGNTLKIKNQNGKLIGIGKVVWKVVSVEENVSDYSGICVLITLVKKLPKAEIYELTLGTEDAGAYTFAELVAEKWKVWLGYGNL